MWSNISAPKSSLKAAQVGQQVKHESALDQQENKRELSGQFANRTGFNDSPLMRYKHAVCSSPGGFIYIHGGRFANGVPLDDDVWRFDPHENCWLQLKTSGCKPPSLQEHTLNEYQGQLYMFGGQVSAASGQESFFWRLDLAKCHWSSLSMDASNCSSLKYGVRLGPTNRRGHSACVYKDSIYIFGGYEDFRGSTNQLWQYDLLNDRWELRNLSSSSACHPEPRHNHSAIIHQDSMYIYGGLSNLKSLGDLWRWSWRDKRWFRERTRGQSPGQLHGHTAIQAFGSMFVFGGERQNGRTTRSLWRLNLSNLCWQKIKPKGPKPNPTTWHAAIANPLGILDEANYFIEGDASDLELDHHQEDELMMVVGPQQQTPSDNCFSSTDMQQQQTIPMETIRPQATPRNQLSNQAIELQNGRAEPHLQLKAQRALANTAHSQHRSISRLKVSKSSSEQMSCLAGKPSVNQSRDRVTKAKRSRLRLSFLRRNSKTKKTGDVKPIPTSWSAASILNASTLAKQDAHDALPKRHSLALAERGGAALVRGQDVEMTSVDVEREQVADTNVAILDNLDSDIKCMFQRAMSPAEHEDEFEAPSNRKEMMPRDSMTQSQLSSCVGPTTTQTYQTARDHLSSQSTLTVTSPVGAADRHFPADQSASNATSGLAQGRQRKSVHQFNPPRGRPKSEIVQSLIDRADARIKHLYTPYFNPEANQNQHHAKAANQAQSQEARVSGANDSILGELANHRMFDRFQTGSHRAALDKSKRHTIHQTMTYYNLYFAEERRLDGSSGNDSSSSPPATSGERQSAANQAPKGGVSTSESNDKSLSNNHHTNSTSAALVGVHDGASSSGGDSSQRTIFLGRLESELGSLMPSSDSRTICADPNSEADYRPRGEGQVRDGPGPGQRMSQFGTNDELNNTADNTSLSFSVIAEFEEDDMLQYSSPTDLVMQQRRSGDEESDSDGDERADDEPGDNFKMERHPSGAYNGVAADHSKGQTMQPQKSTSSGYDSIRSAQSSSIGHQQRRRPQNENALNSSAGSIGDSPRTANSSPQQSEQHFRSTVVKHEPASATTTASSTTADSLALTTNDTSDCCPLTPPSKSLPSSPPDSSGANNMRARQNSSFASSLMSGPARLFSRKRAAKTRYWQLCMFVIGGKQQGGHHNAGNLNEPIAIWRLYI